MATLASSWVAPVSKGQEEDPRAVLDFYFLEILNGYLRNAGKTSPSCAKFSISSSTNYIKERRKP